jgi:diacylglycerol kinase-like protein
MMATVIDPRAWYIVVNPASGAGRAARFAPRLAAALGRANVPFRCVESAAPAGARAQFARAAAAGWRRLLALGGDGTFNELVNGFLDSGVPPRDCHVAAAAGGTGNDWSRAMESRTTRIASPAAWRAVPGARPHTSRDSSRRWSVTARRNSSSRSTGGSCRAGSCWCSPRSGRAAAAGCGWRRAPSRTTAGSTCSLSIRCRQPARSRACRSSSTAGSQATPVSVAIRPAAISALDCRG